MALARLARRPLVHVGAAARSLRFVSPPHVQPKPRTFVTLSPEVSDALARGQPVVALESTIISHGLPHPRNLEAARTVEGMVRASGAVPATTALIDGQALVGLTAAQLERLAEPAAAAAPAPVKTSRRDIARVLAAGQGAVCGTTVSGTMVLAHAAGVPIFATGGIGGVHRGGHNSLDVSADLAELGRTPVAVFCSGAKSILDIPRTLEYLETQGVSVAAFRQAGAAATREAYEGLSTSGAVSASASGWASVLSRTTAFPSFYTAASDRQVPLVGGTAHAAALIAASQRAQLTGGMVFGVPIPVEHEMGAEITSVVERAVRESEEQGIAASGKDATPWLLKRVKELCPASVDSNVALVTNNAKLAAWTAVDLARLRADAQTNGAQKVYPSAQPRQDPALPTHPAPWITVIGGAVVDITAQLHGPASRRSTAPGTVRASLGGVGRNMAEAAQRMIDTVPPAHAAHVSTSRRDCALGVPPGTVRFVGPTTGDTMSVLLRTLWSAQTPSLRLDGLIDLPQHRAEGTPTASLMLFDNGDLEQGVIQASLVERLTEQHVDTALAQHTRETHAPTALLDANLSVSVLRRALDQTSRNGSLALLEPTSVAKSVRGVEAVLMDRSGLASASNQLPSSSSLVMTPNMLELQAMVARARHLAPEAFSTSPQATLTKGAHEPLHTLLTDALRGSGVSTDGPDDPVSALLNDMMAFTGTVAPVALTLGSHGVLLVLPPAVLAQMPPRAPESAANGTAWRVAPPSAGPAGPETKTWELIHVPPPLALPAESVVNTTGAGDTFAGALTALLAVWQQRSRGAKGGAGPWSHLHAPQSTLALAQAAAIQTLQSHRAVGDVHRLASVPELAGVWAEFFT